MNLNLDDHQKRIAMIAGAVVAVLMLLWVVVLPRLGIGGIDDKIKVKENELREVIRLYKSFEQIKGDFNRIESQINRNQSLSLLSELSRIAEKVNVKQASTRWSQGQAEKRLLSGRGGRDAGRENHPRGTDPLLYEIEYSTRCCAYATARGSALRRQYAAQRRSGSVHLQASGKLSRLSF
jgi:hypothetical protein